ncbi:MAG: PDZ domain-containing protein [Planctomycetaceae bacterium]
MNTPCKILLLCCVLAVPSISFARPVQVENSPVEPVVSKLISQLESPRFRDRQTATRLLLKRGATAIPPLKKRVYSGRLELAVRAISIFESAYIGKDPAAAAAADDALEELAESDRQELAEHAKSVLERNYGARTRFAVENLRRLGGEVDNYPDRQNDPSQQGVPFLILNKKWKGGAKGLKYVRRLKGSRFQIYVIDGVPLAERDIVELEASFDNPVVARRGSAMLGISGARAAAGCLIMNVVEGKAAEAAGLRSGDIIQELDGKQIEDFEKLVELLRDKQADDIIQLKVLREPRTEAQAIRVKLGHWRPPTSGSSATLRERANPAGKPKVKAPSGTSKKSPR